MQELQHIHKHSRSDWWVWLRWIVWGQWRSQELCSCCAKAGAALRQDPL